MSLFKKLNSKYGFKPNAPEENAFTLLLLVIIVIKVLGATFSYVYNYQWSSLPIITYLATVLIFLCIPSRTRLKLYWLFFIPFLSCNIMDWFIMGGAGAGKNYFFLMLTLITFSITDAKHHVYYFIIISSVLVILFTLESLNPQAIEIVKPDQKTLYDKSHIGFVIAFTVLSLAGSYLKRVFQNQRKLISQKNDELIYSNKQRTTFFMNLAHETKTPLTLISNNLDKFIKLNGASKEIQVIKNNVDKLKRDMVNFFDTEKIELGRMVYRHTKPINISDRTAMNLDLFESWAKSKNIKILSEIEKDAFVKIDEAAFDRIIDNLVDNAIKFNYNETTGFAKVQVFSKNGKVYLVVEDNGIGIDTHELDNIFKPYYQINHEKSNEQGIGLGLSIVNGIINEASGSIVLSSKKGKGTIITVCFEAYQPTETELHYYKESSGILSSPEYVTSAPINKIVTEGESLMNVFKPTLLVLEDNVDLLAYLIDELNNEYNVFSAINGLNALEILKKIPVPDVIISDIMMNEMDGLEFIKHIKSIPRLANIPFIFVSAKVSENDRLLGLETGAMDYMTKPFSIDELKLKISNLITRDHEQKDNLLNKIKEILYSNTSYITGSAEKASHEFIIKNNCKTMGVTDREYDIVKLLAEGKTYETVADELHISKKTVARHINNLYQKIGVNNKIGLLNRLTV
jgi:signal transduction histidine kinase/DNA-binding NarL/FixJ family response regulator